MILENVKRICKERNMTISALEKAAKLTNGAISKWEKSYPRADNLKAVADCLSVSTDELLRDDIEA